MSSSHLRLVRSFSDSNYPYLITLDPRVRSMMFGKEYFDEYSSVPLSAEMGRIRQALNMTRTNDYRLFEEAGKIKLHLPTEEKFQHMMIALTFGNTLTYDVQYDFSDMSKRLLKKRMVQVAEKLDDTPLHGRFRLQADIPQSTLSIITYDKPAYFVMRRIKPEEHILGIDIV